MGVGSVTFGVGKTSAKTPYLPYRCAGSQRQSESVTPFNHALHLHVERLVAPLEKVPVHLVP
jgi:hypothetical protein